MPRWLLPNLIAVFIAAVGGIIAYGVGFPAPFLTGSALAVTMISLWGVKTDILPLLRNGVFMLIGIAIGSSVTPEVYQAAREWPASFMVLLFMLIVIFAAGALILQHYWQFDRQTALLCSSPGHLSYILGLSVGAKGDLPTISVVQSIRVLSLTLIVPFIVQMLGYKAPEIASQSIIVMALLPLALLVAISVVFGFALMWVGVPAAFLLAGLFVSALAHMNGWAIGAAPDWMLTPAIIIMGAVLGTRFSGVSMATLKKAFSAGIANTAIALGLSGLAAIGFSYVSNISVSQLLIAFAPGGVEVMGALALILDADPTFVAAHHAWRLVILTVLAPLALRLSR